MQNYPIHLLMLTALSRPRWPVARGCLTTDRYQGSRTGPAAPRSLPFAMLLLGIPAAARRLSVVAVPFTVRSCSRRLAAPIAPPGPATVRQRGLSTGGRKTAPPAKRPGAETPMTRAEMEKVVQNAKDEERWMNVLMPERNWGLTSPVTWVMFACIGALFV
eukprot:COSAG06_NODE_255_length_19038_cov_16.597381_9_plen_161_part_00